MTNKNKMMSAPKAKTLKAAQSEETELKSPSIEACTPLKRLTDEEALAIGVRSLSSIRTSITKKEIWAINSMISYVAYNQKLDEETVRAILFAHFDVEEMEQISHQNYDRSICFLVDFQSTKYLN